MVTFSQYGPNWYVLNVLFVLKNRSKCILIASYTTFHHRENLIKNNIFLMARFIAPWFNLARYRPHIVQIRAQFRCDILRFFILLILIIDAQGDVL